MTTKEKQQYHVELARKQLRNALHNLCILIPDTPEESTTVEEKAIGLIFTNLWSLINNEDDDGEVAFWEMHCLIREGNLLSDLAKAIEEFYGAEVNRTRIGVI